MRWGAMHLVTILLPLDRRDGSPQPAALFGEVRAELVERFGGATFFTRAPAEGVWEDGGEIDEDRIVLVEVEADTLERGWWTEYRRRLEAAFCQDEVLIRASAAERL